MVTGRPEVTGRAPKRQIVAGNRRFSQIHPFFWKVKHLERAMNRKKPKIFTENRRFSQQTAKPQIGLCHLRPTTVSAALPWAYMPFALKVYFFPWSFRFHQGKPRNDQGFRSVQNPQNPWKRQRKHQNNQGNALLIILPWTKKNPRKGRTGYQVPSVLARSGIVLFERPSENDFSTQGKCGMNTSLGEKTVSEFLHQVPSQQKSWKTPEPQKPLESHEKGPTRKAPLIELSYSQMAAKEAGGRNEKKNVPLSGAWVWEKDNKQIKISK